MTKANFALFLGITLIIALTLLACTIFYLENTRYVIVATQSNAYKMDRKTGDTWMIAGDKQLVVKPSSYR